MKGRVFLFLFAIPFFAVGAWMGWSVGGNLLDHLRMQSWVPVQATLSGAGYRTHSGDESDTYEAYASYEYTFAGRQYSGNRVGIEDGADNIGDYHQDIARRLQSLRSRGEPVTIYVDPDQAGNAVIDRSLRWGMLMFKGAFLLVFGGVGLGLMIWAIRSPAAPDPEDPAFVATPWLAREAWQSSGIRSSSKATMWGSWAFAGFWNLISAPLPFIIYAEITEKNNLPALLGLLFPLVGLALLHWAIKRTLEWRRFGPAPVVLDPFPGAVGGHVGGTIDLRLPFDPATEVTLTLTALKSHVSGSGKNRSRKESAAWQDKQQAHVAAGSAGTRLSFRFDVPDDLAASDAVQESGTYHIWRLNLHAELPGADLDRDYEIPVYATGEQSRFLGELSIERAKGEQKKIDTRVVEELVRLDAGPGGPTMHYPMGRGLGLGFALFAFGSVFAGAGWYLLFHEGHAFMGIIFGGAGLLIVAGALYTVLNSLEIRQEGGELVTVRRILGIVVRRRRMRRDNFVRFRRQKGSTSSSGSKHTVYYGVNAVDGDGNVLVVGEGFKGVSQANAAAELVARHFGLRPREPVGAAHDYAGEEDLLTTD